MPRAASASRNGGRNASPETSARRKRRQRDALLVRLLQDDPQKRRRAHVAIRTQLGHRLHLLLRLAGAAGKHRAAQRMRAGFEHRTRRREVIGKAVVDEIARAESRGEQRPRQAPVIGTRALGLVNRPGRREHAAAIGPTAASLPLVPLAAKPPKGRASFWRSSSSDFRVTGSRASAARDVTADASMPARILANAGVAACA